jgi:pimeloyl-ACP methyl ester carboxylesterase
MAKLEVTTGYFKNGLPYTRIGSGPRKLVIFEGLNFSHKPPSGLMLRMISSSLKRLAKGFTVYYVSRKPCLPTGYSMRDMSEDYATMIRDELGGPVDVMGVSTGGPIAQHFAVDHPDLVHRLVLAMTGYCLTEEGRKLQRHVGDQARRRNWRAAYSSLIGGVYRKGIKKLFFKWFAWLFGAIGAPADPSDGLVEIEAEDSHNFKDRLAEITVPTLVIGGEEDFFYPIRETAVGIANAKLIVYEGVGHAAMMKRQFSEDVLAFLTEGTIQIADC